jgi:hypothetical protein
VPKVKRPTIELKEQQMKTLSQFPRRAEFKLRGFWCAKVVVARKKKLVGFRREKNGERDVSQR